MVRAKPTLKMLVRKLALLGGVISIGLFGLAGSASADILVQGMASSGTLTAGTIVAVSDSKASTVVAAPSSDPSRIYGVVINQSDAAVTEDGTGSQVYIATSGDYSVTVSTQGGVISSGDYISVSTTDGIGAKANDNQSTVIGRALQAFNGTGSGVDKTGKYPKGQITVNISPGPNPNYKNGADVPLGLHKLGNTIAGKAVSSSRVYASLVIFLVATGLAAGLLWIGARGSITAIGRNPLSRQSIMASLFQVVGVAITVFIIGLVGVYLLLRI